MKTTLQVEGAKGLTVLRGRIAQGGPFVLYHGAIATYSATWVGQYVDLLCFHLLTSPPLCFRPTVRQKGKYMLN